MKNLKIVAAVLLMYLCVAFHANAATVERTISPSRHMVYSWTEQCTVTEVQHESNRDVIFVVVDGTEDIYSFYDTETDYWKSGMKLKALFDLCVTCEDKYPELNSVIE